LKRCRESKTAIVVTSSLGPGGAERQVVATLDGLAQSAHEFESIKVIAFSLSAANRSNFFQSDLEDNGHRVDCLKDIDSEGLLGELMISNPETGGVVDLIQSLPPDMSERCLGLYATFRTEQPTVVQAWQDTTNIVCALAAILAGVPRIVLTTCSTRPRSRSRFRRYLHSAYQALSLRDDVLIINNSDAGARDYEQWLGLAGREVLTVRNGLDTARVKRVADQQSAGEIKAALGFPVDCLMLGGVMRFSDVKRPDLWVASAMALINARPDCRALLVGDGPLRPELQRLVEQHALEDRIIMPGTQIPVEPWMAAMDLLFLSSRMEGLPNVLIEAQTLGVPVLSMNVGGCSEAFVDGVSGKLMEDPNPELIAKEIQSILDDKCWLDEASRQASLYAEENFSLHALAKGTLDSFRILNSELSDTVADCSTDSDRQQKKAS